MGQNKHRPIKFPQKWLFMGLTWIYSALLQHLREEFPGPESNPWPELSEENSSGKVRFDLRQ